MTSRPVLSGMIMCSLQLIRMALVVALWTTAGWAGPVRYQGMCDASAAVPIGNSHFAVANDEDSVLRVYRRDPPGKPSYERDLGRFLKAPDGETDIEGATRIGSRIYWITSHGRNAKGELRPDRQRLFVTVLQGGPDGPSLSPVGMTTTLLESLVAAPRLRPLRLAEAARKAPESVGGLNIEGLSRTPTGGLMIGFRNPIPDRKALIVPLDNPDETIAGGPPRFGKPVLLPLGGLGIRSLEYSDTLGAYLIVSGPPDDGDEFRLFQWSGNARDAPLPLDSGALRGLHPEALVLDPEDESHPFVLSDDGGVEVGGKKCKKADADRKSFRAVSLGH